MDSTNFLDYNMWTQLNSLLLYPHKATSVFLPPIFVFHTKFEFSLEFTQRRLVHQKSFLPVLLVGIQPYPTDASRRAYKLYKY